jgi:integrase
MKIPSNCPPPVTQNEEDDMMEFLLVRNKTYYFRRRIPVDLAKYFPDKLKDITRSLATSDGRRAKTACRDWVSRIEDLFTTLRLSISEEHKLAHVKAELFNNVNPMLVQAQIPISPLLSHLIEEYISYNAPNWEPKTRQENEFNLGLSLQLLGDLPLDKIDYNAVKVLREKLQHLPTNFSRRKKYKHMALEEILAIPVEDQEPPNPEAVNKTLSYLSSLLKMGVARHGKFIQTNPAVGLKLKIVDQKLASEERDIYTPDDLQNIVNLLTYDPDNPARFWVPLVGIFSGLRRGEICQLYTRDIIVQDGLLCFDLNTKCDKIPYTPRGKATVMVNEKKLKKEASVRVVPIHPVLLNECGFAGYVEYCRLNGQKRLFEDLHYSRDGYGTYFSKWFDLAFNPQITPPKSGKTFHSLRHNFMDWFKQNRIEIFDEKKAPKILKEIVGHAYNRSGEEDLIGERYGKRYKAAITSQMVYQLDYNLDMWNVREQVGPFRSLEEKLAKENKWLPDSEHPTLCEDER